MSRIISYRGLIADGGQDTINLHTNDGKTGYKVVKFQVMTSEPGDHQQESTVKIYKIPQSTVDNTIDFSDNTLLGAAIWQAGNVTGSDTIHVPSVVVFDNEIFNQDIYVTHSEIDNNNPVNYYIELEQVDLTEDQALIAIVKNLRNEQ